MGIAGIKGNAPRAVKLSNLISTHLFNISRTTGVFDQVNPALLNEELKRFECLEDSCIFRFARTAGISIIIRGQVEDRGDSLFVKLYAFGVDAPYSGNLIFRYRVAIPISGLELQAREYSYICEEHAGHFLSQLLNKFKFPVAIKAKAGKFILDYSNKISGFFPLYRYDKTSSKGSLKVFKEIGAVTLENNAVIKQAVSPLTGDFILISFKEKAHFLQEFYYGRKREIVFEDSSIGDSLYAMLFHSAGKRYNACYCPAFWLLSTRRLYGTGPVDC